MRSTGAILLVTLLAICWTAFAANHPIMVALKLKIRPAAQQLNSAICPDNTRCPTDNTCCQLTTDGYGCCSKINAVCCSDGAHCCPQGYVCDLQNQACLLGNGTNSTSPKLLKFESLLAAKPKLQIFPCGVGYCQDNESCCPNSGCCPYPAGASCCYDGRCCPPGTTCTYDDKCLYR